jgi:hypothetical protein
LAFLVKLARYAQVILPAAGIFFALRGILDDFGIKAEAGNW